MALALSPRYLAATLCAGILSSAVSTAAFADERCGQLVALHKQYAGVKLTDDQKQLKVQLVAWYKENCGSVRGGSRRALLGNAREAQN